MPTRGPKEECPVCGLVRKSPGTEKCRSCHSSMVSWAYSVKTEEHRLRNIYRVWKQKRDLGLK